MDTEATQRLWSGTRVKTPVVLQMEAVECGAAALGMVLAYHGRFVPLEELRIECGVSRDGSNAANIVKAARKYGLTAKGFTKDGVDGLMEHPLPSIVFWRFNHFVVLTGMRGGRVHVNDPASGPVTMTRAEFDDGFSGVVLSFEPGPEFKRGGAPPSLAKAIVRRLAGIKPALAYVVVAGVFLALPGVVVPVFSSVFVDKIFIDGQRSWLAPLLAGMALTAILRGYLTWLRGRCLARMELKLAISSAAEFMLHVLMLPISFFQQRHAGDLCHRVSLNDRTARLLSGELSENCLNLVMIGFFAVVMTQYDLTLTAVGVVIAALNFLLLRQASSRRITLNQALQMESGRLAGAAMQTLQSIESVKAAGMEADIFGSWAGIQARVSNFRHRMALSNTYLTAFPFMLSTVNTAAILAVGGWRVTQGELSIGALVAFQSSDISTGVFGA